MFSKILHFIKYNNATIIILAVILILGGGVLAAGPEAVGEKQTEIRGLDNTLLIQADLAGLNMDFKIENIEQDEKYYYVTYGYLDLAVINRAWQYQLNQKTVKISRKIKDDLGVYLAKYLAKHYEARLRELKLAQAEALTQGEQKRVEVTEYSGLVGRTLNLAAKVFPGYEPIKKRELPTPELMLPDAITPALSEGEAVSGADNLTQIYNDYVASHPDLLDMLEATTTLELAIDTASTTPADSTGSTGSPQDSSPQTDSTAPAGDASPGDTPAPADSTTPPAIPEPTSVEIIELPAPVEAPADEPAPVETPAPEVPAESAPIPAQ